MSDFLHIEDQEYVFIGEGSHLEGDMSFYGDTRIAASIEGNIKMDKNFPLIIEPSGKVKGTIKCSTLEIYGEVEGDVYVEGTLIVHPYAKLKGQINAQNFIIKPGAVINMEGKSLSL